MIRSSGGEGGRDSKRVLSGPSETANFEGFLSRVCDVESMGCEGRSKGPVMVGFWYENSHGVRDRSKRFMNRAYLGFLHVVSKVGRSWTAWSKYIMYMGTWSLPRAAKRIVDSI